MLRWRIPGHGAQSDASLIISFMLFIWPGVPSTKSLVPLVTLISAEGLRVNSPSMDFIPMILAPVFFRIPNSRMEISKSFGNLAAGDLFEVGRFFPVNGQTVKEFHYIRVGNECGHVRSSNALRHNHIVGSCHLELLF